MDYWQIENVRVLLVEDNPIDARTVREVLSEARGAMDVRHGLFTVTRVERLEPALELLVAERFGVVLLDLRLPDSDGLETLAQIRSAAGNTPIVVLAGVDDDRLALAAIQQGAQDFLAKGRLESSLLRRTIRHAVERKRGEVQLRRHTREVELAHAHIEKQAQELKRRTEQLDRINRELDDFAYIASHDLKEPLRGISAYCEMLLEDYGLKLDDGGQHKLETLVNLCNRLETLISDLLTYCRVGGPTPAETGIDLNAVTDEVLDTLRPAIDYRNATVRVVDHLPTVTGDPTLIGMAISNLVSNGIKFNDNDRPVVEIGCLPTSPPTIFVRDDGIGIAEKHHEAIFTIFRRLHTRKEYDGSGAGLTIVRKIVESHGGRVWLESERGSGSTLYLTLEPSEAPSDTLAETAAEIPTEEIATPVESAKKGPHWMSQPAAERATRR